MTSKEMTYSMLDCFLKNNKIDEKYLNDTLVRKFENMVKEDDYFGLYDVKLESSRKLVRMVFMELTNDRLKLVNSPCRYVCTSQQLKDFLNDYGNGYSSLKDLDRKASCRERVSSPV